MSGGVLKRCPVCRKPRQAEHTPFCSPRCRDRDDQKFLELARDAGADWLVTAEGQKAIADYKIGGEQLFFPNYGP